MADDEVVAAMRRPPLDDERRVVVDSDQRPRCHARIVLNQDMARYDAATERVVSTEEGERQCQAAAERLVLQALTRIVVVLRARGVDALPERLTVSLVATSGSSWYPYGLVKPCTVTRQPIEYTAARRTWFPRMLSGDAEFRHNVASYVFTPLLDADGVTPLALPLGLMWRTGVAVVVSTDGEPASFDVRVEGFARNDVNPVWSSWRSAAVLVPFREHDVAPSSVGAARLCAMRDNRIGPRCGFTNIWTVMDEHGVLAFACGAELLAPL